MYREVDLLEAKNIIGSDRVFLNGDSFFNVVDVGKYKSGFTFIIPRVWPLDFKGEPVSPIRYRECREITENMNIYFNGTPQVLFGKYFLSKSEKPVFKLTPPEKASDVLIKVNWGGCFNEHRGASAYYAKEIGAKCYKRCCSNGGGLGSDYWVLPIGFVYNAEKRDVSNILHSLTEEISKKILNDERTFLAEEARKNESVALREKVIPDCKKIIADINKLIQPYNKIFKCTFRDDAMVRETWGTKYSYMEALEYLKREFDNYSQRVAAREKYNSVIKNVTERVVKMHGKLTTDIQSVGIELPQRSTTYFDCIDLPTVNKMVEFIEAEENRLVEIEKDIIRKQIEVKRLTGIKKLKMESKEAGCPETFIFRNRLNGKTALSHAYVIRADGTIREPDDNILQNRNHSHMADWLLNADGDQVYKQILIGELIITYEKDCTAAPVILSVKWKPETTTEAQKETVKELLDSLQDKYDSSIFVDQKGETIQSVNQWIFNNM